MKSRTSRTRPAFFAAMFAISSVCLLQIACGDDDNAVKETLDSGKQNPVDSSTAPDTSTQPDGATLTDAGCYVNPTTHIEIINACTDASFIKKNPTLSKLLPDGGLPPP